MLVVGAVIVGASILHGGSGTRPVSLALGTAAVAALALRRRAPGWSLAISGAFVLVLVHLDSATAPLAVLAPAVALFSLALTRGRRDQLIGAAAAVAMVITAEVLRDGSFGAVQTLGHIALVAVPLLLAETLRTRRSYVALLLERLAVAERTREQEATRRVEQERMRIARELHDVVAHTLTTITVQAGVAGHLLEGDPEHARGALALIEDAGREAIGELRAILGVLRDPDESDAPRAPTPGVDDIAGLVRRVREAGLDAELAVAGTRGGRLSDVVSLAAYRIVQESLTNARRHAPGATVCVQVSFAPDSLTLAVRNAAAMAHNAGSTSGVGIAGMAERAAAVGGSLRAEPGAGGFLVTATLPYVLPPL